MGKTLARDTLYAENLPAKLRRKLPHVIIMDPAIPESRNMSTLERLVELIEGLLRDIRVPILEVAMAMRIQRLFKDIRVRSKDI